MSNLGLESGSRTLSTPIEKLKAQAGEEEPLEQSECTRYRGLVARLNYLAQDRSDVQFAIKELSSYMSNPTKESLSRVK